MSRSNGRWYVSCVSGASVVLIIMTCDHPQYHPLTIPTFLVVSGNLLAAETRSRRQIEMIQISCDSHNSVSMDGPVPVLWIVAVKGRTPGELSTNQRPSLAAPDQSEAALGAGLARGRAGNARNVSHARCPAPTNDSKYLSPPHWSWALNRPHQNTYFSYSTNVL